LNKLNTSINDWFQDNVLNKMTWELVSNISVPVEINNVSSPGVEVSNVLWWKIRIMSDEAYFDVISEPQLETEVKTFVVADNNDIYSSLIQRYIVIDKDKYYEWDSINTSYWDCVLLDFDNSYVKFDCSELWEKANNIGFIEMKKEVDENWIITITEIKATSKIYNWEWVLDFWIYDIQPTMNVATIKDILSHYVVFDDSLVESYSWENWKIYITMKKPYSYWILKRNSSIRDTFLMYIFDLK